MALVQMLANKYKLLLPGNYSMHVHFGNETVTVIKYGSCGDTTFADQLIISNIWHASIVAFNSQYVIYAFPII